jgi:hypothetical protein
MTIQEITIPRYYQRNYGWGAGEWVEEHQEWYMEGYISKITKQRVDEIRCMSRRNCVRRRLMQLMDEYTGTKKSAKGIRIDALYSDRVNLFERSEIAVEYRELLKEYWDTSKLNKQNKGELYLGGCGKSFKELFSFENK